MKVQGTVNQNMIAVQSKPAGNGKPKTEGTKSEQQGVATKSGQPVSTSQGNAKGVMRLLQEGHFTGKVADVRLRINFHDQLSALSSENAAGALREGSEQLLDDLRTYLLGPQEAGDRVQEKAAESISDFAEIVQSNGLEGQVAGAFDRFEQEVRFLFQAGGGEPVDPGRVYVAMNQAFSVMVEALGAATMNEAAQANESTVPSAQEQQVSGDGQIPVTAEFEDNVLTGAVNGMEIGEDQDETNRFPLAEFIGALQGWFEQRVGDLRAEVTEASRLPELSEPKGNGAAYSRFLQVYEEINGITSQDGDENIPPIQNDGLETEA